MGSSSDTNFLEKVVIILGASSSIGRSIAIKFAQLGANLVLIGSNSKYIQAIEKLCCAYLTRKPLTITADITKDDEVENIIETTIMHFNKIDILINNAGIVENGSIIDTDVYQYDRIFNTNVRSIYHITNMCVPYLIASKGNIVNISCVAGLKSFPGILAYCMSNAAIEQFTKCVALELAPKGVRVNCVNSGIIFFDAYIQNNDKKSGDLLEKTSNKHVIRRVCDGQDIAEATAFFASDKAGFITGSSVTVDGGSQIM